MDRRGMKQTPCGRFGTRYFFANHEGCVPETHRGWKDKGLMKNWGLGEKWPVLTVIKLE